MLDGAGGARGGGLPIEGGYDEGFSDEPRAAVSPAVQAFPLPAPAPLSTISTTTSRSNFAARRGRSLRRRGVTVH
jgi:hypothetical protein